MNISVRFRQSSTQNTPSEFLRMEQSVYSFSFLILSNLDEIVFSDLFLRRKHEKDLEFSRAGHVRLRNHINLFCCTHH